jgi:hypothetical protein
MRLARLKSQFERLSLAQEIGLPNDFIKHFGAKRFSQGGDGLLREQVRHGFLPIQSGIARKTASRFSIEYLLGQPIFWNATAHHGYPSATFCAKPANVAG